MTRFIVSRPNPHNGVTEFFTRDESWCPRWTLSADEALRLEQADAVDLAARWDGGHTITVGA